MRASTPLASPAGRRYRRYVAMNSTGCAVETSWSDPRLAIRAR
jgi:hypothetical protein